MILQEHKFVFLINLEIMSVRDVGQQCDITFSLVPTQMNTRFEVHIFFYKNYNGICTFHIIFFLIFKYKKKKIHSREVNLYQKYW